ncbi:MAG: heparinase II/III family protein [Bacteroidales bacterium]|jgi:hypothetical protein|nr:heparinase II/III family protein [Bacteroidales bacterium]
MATFSFSSAALQVRHEGLPVGDTASFGADQWQRIRSVEDVCLLYPERMAAMLQQLRCDAPGMAKVAAAFADKQLTLACEHLLEYYRTAEAPDDLYRRHIWWEVVSPEKEADLMIRQGIYTENKSHQAAVPRTSDGHLDWNFRGTVGDMEWAWALNRFYHAEILLDAYRKTGNPVYAKAIDLHVKDWIIAGMPYPARKNSTAMWRGLETAQRAEIFTEIFYKSVKSGQLSPASLLLLLSSIPEHAHYLNRFHSAGNWATIEMAALATIAAAFPEWKASGEWIRYAAGVMSAEIEKQVYPDGAQTELSSSYHRVALKNFDHLYRICRRKQIALPENYRSRIEGMWHYLAATMRPNGYGLLNNDSDLEYYRHLVEQAAAEYGREEWKAMAACENSTGVMPPSVVFPWAGHFVMRSGYDSTAHWSFFDMGPWGTGHQHNDKLHLSVAAFGNDFLVDAGRFAYQGSLAQRFRQYACSSAAHNLLLIDGCGQAPGIPRAREALTEKYYSIDDRFDYASASFESFDGIEGTCEHTRVVCYLRGQCWIVVDKISSDRNRTVETLWHWHPSCTVTMNAGQTASGNNGNGWLHIIPAGNARLTASMVKGQEQPTVQGWYSKTYNEVESTTTSIYAAQTKNDTVLVWMLYPSKHPSPKLPIKAHADSLGVTVKFKLPGNASQSLYIPFADSRKAALKITD